MVYKAISQKTGKPISTNYFDILGRQILTKTEDGFGDPKYTLSQYLANGLLHKNSLPYRSPGPILFKEYTYDGYGRMVNIENPNDNSNTISYGQSGLLYWEKNLNNATNQYSQNYYDASGKIVKTNSNSGTLDFTYGGHGNLVKVMRGTETLQTMSYDNYGRQTQLIDQNSGTSSFQYNAFGQLTTETKVDAPTDITYNYTYDDLGRILTISGPDGPINHNYISSGNGLNNLQSMVGPGNMALTYSYDNLGRAITETQTISGEDFVTQFGYDLQSRINHITYPTGFEIENQFLQNNSIHKVIETSSGQTIFENQQLNELGQCEKFTTGDGKVFVKDINSLGYTESLKINNITRFTYEWNLPMSGLISWNNYSSIFTEEFEFDFEKDRLKKSTLVGLGGPVGTEITFGSNGNILSKTGLGNYSYSTQAPNAVEGVECTDNSVPGIQQAITYTPFKKISTISEGNFVLNILYGPDRQRKKTALSNAGSQVKEIIFCGNYERVTIGSDIYHIHYINGADGLFAINIRHAGIDNIYYVLKDHQGSIIKVTKGSFDYSQSFDAWGRERNPQNGTYTPNPDTRPPWLIRGYTGHEHLFEFNLINMNGRAYDPILARMLSPDNYIQAPLNLENYNRYSYALNNPLKYSDPTGNWVEYVLAAAIIVGYQYYQGVQANNGEMDPTKWDWSNATYTVGYTSGGGSKSVSAGVGWSNQNQVTVGGGTGGLQFGYNSNGISYHQNVTQSGSGNSPTINMPSPADAQEWNSIGQFALAGTETSAFDVSTSNMKLPGYFGVDFEGHGMPTIDKGGFISKDLFIDYMVYQARNNENEVSAFQIQKGGEETKYFVLPWIDNKARSSICPVPTVGNYISGYIPSDVKSQIHTHKVNPNPSEMDHKLSKKYGIPIHIIMPNRMVNTANGMETIKNFNLGLEINWDE